MSICKSQNLKIKRIFEEKGGKKPFLVGWWVGSLLLQSASFQSNVGAETFMWNSKTPAVIPHIWKYSPAFTLSLLTVVFFSHSAYWPQTSVWLRSALARSLRSCVPASRASLSLERGHGSVGLNPHYWLSDGQKQQHWTEWTAALRVGSIFDVISMFVLHLTAAVFMIYDFMI